MNDLLQQVFQTRVLLSCCNKHSPECCWLIKSGIPHNNTSDLLQEVYPHKNTTDLVHNRYFPNGQLHLEFPHKRYFQVEAQRGTPCLTTHTHCIDNGKSTLRQKLTPSWSDLLVTAGRCGSPTESSPLPGVGKGWGRRGVPRITGTLHEGT